MSSASERGVTPFADDVARQGGYAYTTDARLSSVLANGRLTAAVLACSTLDGKSVLDVGCGDATYTSELLNLRKIRRAAGADPNVPALAAARGRQASRGITFVAASAQRLPFANDAFDVGQLRGVLHHLDDPGCALLEALRVCRSVVVVEPNGYNAVLKILERLSPYHRQHHEKSYAPHRLDRWVAAAGGEVRQRMFAGLVPMFCPDWLARLCKRLEPFVENVPMLRQLVCAVYVFRIERRSSR